MSWTDLHSGKRASSFPVEGLVVLKNEDYIVRLLVLGVPTWCLWIRLCWFELPEWISRAFWKTCLTILVLTNRNMNQLFHWNCKNIQCVFKAKLWCNASSPFQQKQSRVFFLSVLKSPLSCFNAIVQNHQSRCCHMLSLKRREVRWVGGLNAHVCVERVCGCLFFHGDRIVILNML